MSGIPHAATEAFEYKARMVPKGTILFPNLVTLNRDPERYDNPDAFNPLRFIDDELDAYACAVNPDWKKRDHFHYGFGRRVCQGINMGEASLFIAISRILWAFDIKSRPNCALDMFEKICEYFAPPQSIRPLISAHLQMALQPSQSRSRFRSMYETRQRHESFDTRLSRHRLERKESWICRSSEKSSFNTPLFYIVIL